MTDALVVVDMQNLFVDLVAPESPHVVAAVNRYVTEAVRRDRPVFYTRDYAPIELPDGDPDGRADLHPDLDIQGAVVDKGPGKQGGFSGFHLAPVLGPQQPHGGGSMGSLVELLRGAEPKSVTVVGIAADVCVAATARDAVRLGYETTLPLDATAFVHAHPEGDDAAIAELRAAGVVVID